MAVFDDDSNETNEDLEWPPKFRKAFGPGPGRRTAALEWALCRERPLEGYVTGYMLAAQEVFSATVRKRLSPERMVFPLAFLWRHFIELALKDIIAVGRLLHHEEWTHPQGHRLTELWRAARGYIVECGSEDSPEIPVIEQQIAELDEVDPFASGFRYPLDKKGCSNLPSAPTEVDLDQFQDAMERLASLLENVRMAQSVRLDCLRSYHSEM